MITDHIEQIDKWSFVCILFCSFYIKITVVIVLLQALSKGLSLSCFGNSFKNTGIQRNICINNHNILLRFLTSPAEFRADRSESNRKIRTEDVFVITFRSKLFYFSMRVILRLPHLSFDRNLTNTVSMFILIRFASVCITEFLYVQRKNILLDIILKKHTCLWICFLHPFYCYADCNKKHFRIGVGGATALRLQRLVLLPEVSLEHSHGYSREGDQKLGHGAASGIPCGGTAFDAPRGTFCITAWGIESEALHSRSWFVARKGKVKATFIVVQG